MFIEYTFKVNAYSVEKSRISVTYLPLDPELHLEPFHIQQLGVDSQIMLNYGNGIITQAEFQAKMRQQIVNADGMAQEHWNNVLVARQLVVPPEVDGMLGFEWSPVTEQESTTIGSQMETL